jgi:hypothetical protein
MRFGDTFSITVQCCLLALVPVAGALEEVLADRSVAERGRQVGGHTFLNCLKEDIRFRINYNLAELLYYKLKM